MLKKRNKDIADRVRAIHTKCRHWEGGDSSTFVAYSNSAIFPSDSILPSRKKPYHIFRGKYIYTRQGD